MRTPLQKNIRGRAVPRVGLLCALLLVSLGASSTAFDHERSTVSAFAIPANADAAKPWTYERDRLAVKIHRGFGISEATASEFSGWILEASARHELAPELIASLVFTESTFRKHVRSNFGAYGPAQVRVDLWETFCGSNDLIDAEENIYCGAQILAHYQNVCGDEACALRSYNVGYRNRNNDYYAQASARYVGKIDRHRAKLENTQI